MVTITEAAAEKIRDLLGEQGNEGHGLRMGVMGGGVRGSSTSWILRKVPATWTTSLKSTASKSSST